MRVSVIRSCERITVEFGAPSKLGLLNLCDRSKAVLFAHLVNPYKKAF
jgi:hypothetical protein